MHLSRPQEMNHVLFVFSMLHGVWALDLDLLFLKHLFIHEFFPLMSYKWGHQGLDKMLEGNEGLSMRNESMWSAYLIFENTPLVKWFHINVNSTSKSFQTNSWFFQPNSLKYATNFMILLNQFHMWLNLISWIANCSNFMNLLNQFHYMSGPCS